MTLDDVVTMLLAEALDKAWPAVFWRTSTQARLALNIAIEAGHETQRRALRAGWVYR